VKPRGLHYPKFDKPIRSNAQIRKDLAEQLAEAFKRWNNWKQE
jgi:hypothetical protein